MTFSLLRKTLSGAMLGALAAALVLLLTRVLMPDLFARFEAETLDSRYLYRIKYLFKQRGGAPLEEIVIVDIDARSLEKLGRFQQWPRTYHARVVDYLHASGATAIAFDILFMERDADPRADSALVASIKRAGNVINALAFSRASPEYFLYKMQAPPPEFEAQRFALKLRPERRLYPPQEERFVGKFFELYNNSAALGFVNLPEEKQDDAIRHMPLLLNFAGQTYPALALAVARHVRGITTQEVRLLSEHEIWLASAGQWERGLRVPVDDRGRVMINYMGAFQTFRYISYYDVLEQRVPSAFFTGKIVLIGTSAPGLYDLRVVPFQSDFPGVEIHANLIHNLLHLDFIEKQPENEGLVLFGVVAVLVGVIAVLVGLWGSLALALALAAAYVALALWTFIHRNLALPVVEPLLVIGVALLLGMIYRYLSEEREKKLIWGMFGNYLSDSLVRTMLRNPAMLKLGGERKFATAFFSDLKDFTAVSERLTPEEMIRQLNEYLSAMTEIVLQYGGYLDKYEGDAIVAAFGVPVDQRDHAIRACLAALDMQEQMVLLRQKWRQERRPLLEARIGINSGPMIAGNIGGRRRFDYTMIGDSVNLAARLEGVNKMYGTSITISEYTYVLAKAQIIARELDFIRVKGKTKPVKIYELVARRDRGISQETAAVFAHYARGLEYYRLQEWRRAISEFRRVLQIKDKDGPATELLRRCEVFLQSPRPANWDGIFEMHAK